jgi:hypothetical protein
VPATPRRSRERSDNITNQREKNEPFVLQDIRQRHQQKQARRVSQKGNTADNARLLLSHAQRRTDRAYKNLGGEKIACHNTCNCGRQ